MTLYEYAVIFYNVKKRFVEKKTKHLQHLLLSTVPFSSRRIKSSDSISMAIYIKKTWKSYKSENVAMCW